MEKIVLTKSQARAIILQAAGLGKRAPFGKGIEAVYKLIDHLGFIQVDTNYVIERAHHHAIYTRVPDYQLEWLDQLQAEGKIFEFWTWASGFQPMHEFRFSLPAKASFLARRKPMTQTEANMMKRVLDRIGREGPLQARDFEQDRVTKNKGWWDWRPSKVALERLHLEGKLISYRKPNFEKVYDLAENVIPSSIDTTAPTPEEFARHAILRALNVFGIAYVKEIYYSARYVSPNLIKSEILKMAAAGEILPVNVEGIKGPLYMHPAYRKRKVKVSGEAFILSPFDVLNVFRHRLRDFFDFDYMVECFVPKPKRKYGYFALPVLIGDTFIARMDSKADRKQGVYTIYNLHFEKVKMTSAMQAKLVKAIRLYATFNRCSEIAIEKSNHPSVLKALRSALS
jgi:uncharacterized protein